MRTIRIELSDKCECGKKCAIATRLFMLEVTAANLDVISLEVRRMNKELDEQLSHCCTDAKKAT